MTHPTRRGVVTGLAASALSSCATPAERAALSIDDRTIQGGALIGRTTPRAAIRLDDAFVGRASARGLFIVGFDRDATPQAVLRVENGASTVAERIINVAPGAFDVQRIDGLAQDQVTPQTPELIARIADEARRKAVGFASDIDADHFRRGFVMPVKATRVSGRFGGQRILNGTPSRPHYGADLAAPVGTPVRAPAGGVVSFAETGLHYEGGLVMIDHGQGLVTAYLHLSRVFVRPGQSVRRGRKIGEVGQEGRATGPHLCWRMKWRGRNLDPMLLIGTAAPTY